MADRVSFLMKVFRVELEETEASVLGLIDYYGHRFNDHEITNYVWMENHALLRKEISCVRELEKDLDSWQPPVDMEAEEVLAELILHMKSLAKKRGYPDLICLVLDQIGIKLLRYLE